MTTELEKQFFDTFGIERYKKGYCGHSYDDKKCGECPCWEYKEKYYPEITDRKLLELFAIDNVTTYEELRNYILCRIIYNYENDENKRCQVKALFEDKEQ